MRSRTALALLIATSAYPGKAAAQAPEITCTVEHITDGDTIRCGGESVRLLLIDAPEAGQGRFDGAAREFLAVILPVGSEARLVLDLEQRDQYDRLLAYVYQTDGRMVNAMMVRQGGCRADCCPSQRATYRGDPRRGRLYSSGRRRSVGR